MTLFTIRNRLLLDVNLDPNVIIWNRTINTPLCGKTPVCFNDFVTRDTSTTFEGIDILSETLEK